MKLCIFCKHFVFDNATSGFSELTPGDQASIYCDKNHWELDFYDDNVNAFREKIKKGESCKDFEEEQNP